MTSNVPNSTTSPHSPVNMITHKKRSIKDDVNPLIKSSTENILNADDNYIVVKLKDGQVMLGSDFGKNGFIKNLFNKPVKYYEVDRHRYPFALVISSPTNQTSFKYTVTLEFELSVGDPCFVVSQGLTSLLEAVTTDLKRMTADVTTRYSIEDTKRAAEDLNKRLDSFVAPDFLHFKAGVVDIAPDADAMKMLRQIEEERLRLRGQQVRASVGVAESVATSISEKAGGLIEEHQVAKVVSRLGEIGMNPVLTDNQPKE